MRLGRRRRYLSGAAANGSRAGPDEQIILSGYSRVFISLSALACITRGSARPYISAGINRLRRRQCLFRDLVRNPACHHNPIIPVRPIGCIEREIIFRIFRFEVFNSNFPAASSGADATITKCLFFSVI